MTTRRIMIALAALLALAIAVGLVFHPDPSCGRHPEPKGAQ